MQHHLETFLATAEDGDPMSWGVPSWVERDFRAYLKCGILAHGFARARCDACGHERLVAFSCKGRGVCPSCNSRRMAEVGAHLTDHVLPWLPVRQWVLSVPKRLRPYLHHHPEVAGGVLHVFLRAIRSTLRDASPGAPRSVRDARMGAVSFLHRFGSSLNAHFHYHVVVLDGVFSGTEGDGKASAVRFHEASELEPRHWEDLQHTVQRRVLRYFRRHDLLDESTTTDMLAWQASGGFSIDASVRIEGHDRQGIERDHFPSASGAPATVPGRLSRSTACTLWRATLRSARPTPGSCTDYPLPRPTAGPSSSSPPSSFSNAWHVSSLPPESTAIAITASSPRTPNSGPR